MAEQKICQCCGMPLEEALFSREPDGTVNPEYCKWCYADGAFTYTDPAVLIDFCVNNLSVEGWSPEQMRAHMEQLLPTLRHWQK